MVDRKIASHSSSEDAALKRLLMLARDSRRGVLAEVVSGDKSIRCAVSGLCALTSSGEEFTVTGTGFLTFELNSVSSCTFNEELSKPPSTRADASIDADIGLPFVDIRLTNGTRITLNHGVRPA